MCYTFAWSAVVTFAVLNVAGLIIALATGGWATDGSPAGLEAEMSEALGASSGES